MTSYYPDVLYRQARGKWTDAKKFRFATKAEAEAYLAQLRTKRDDILETRVVETPHKHGWVWNFEHGVAQERGMLHPDDARREGHGWRK